MPGNPVDIQPFQPTGNTSLAVSSASSAVTLPTISTSKPQATLAIVRNTGGADARVKFGAVGITAALTDFLIPAGETIDIGIGTATTLAAITPSGSTTLQIATGFGTPTINRVGSSGGGVGLTVGIDQTTPGTTDHVTGSGFATAVGGSAMNVRTSITYASGQILMQSATAGSCAAIAVAVGRANDKTGMIRRLRLKSTDIANFAGKSVRAHVFKDNPTFTNGDGGNFAGGLSESNYLGYFDVTFDQTFSDMVKGIAAPSVGSEINFEPSAGTQNVFIVYEARSAITSAGTTKTITPVFEVLQN